MKISLALSALALLACPAAAADLNLRKDCGETGSTWWFQCAHSVTNCCHFAAEKANATCPMSRARFYFYLNRCKTLYEGSASPYHKTDCVTATLSGIALLYGDRSLDFPVECTIDDIKDMP